MTGTLNVKDIIADDALTQEYEISNYRLIGPSFGPGVETNIFTGYSGGDHLDLGSVLPGKVRLDVTGYTTHNTGRDPIVTLTIYRGIFGSGSPVALAQSKIGGGSDNTNMPLICSATDYTPGQYYSATIETDGGSSPSLSEYTATFRALLLKK